MASTTSVTAPTPYDRFSSAGSRIAPETAEVTLHVDQGPGLRGGESMSRAERLVVAVLDRAYDREKEER